MVSSTLEAFDQSKNRWFLAKVRELRPHRMLLHFVGWPNDHDMWFHLKEQAESLRSVTLKAEIGPFLQLGRHRATNGMRMKDRYAPAGTSLITLQSPTPPCSCPHRLAVCSGGSLITGCICRVQLVLNTIGIGNQISLWSLVRVIARPGS